MTEGKWYIEWNIIPRVNSLLTWNGSLCHQRSKHHLLHLLLLRLIFTKAPSNIGMQIPLHISTSCPPLDTSECARSLAILPCSSKRNEFAKYKRPLLAGLIPISRPNDTLWSWKKDAVDCLIFHNHQHQNITIN